jgi:Collagen triple helix repeat (20 copies)
MLKKKLILLTLSMGLFLLACKDGAMGPEGPQGAVGAQGAKGAKGASGDLGAPGDKGAAGAAGTYYTPINQDGKRLSGLLMPLKVQVQIEMYFHLILKILKSQLKLYRTALGIFI